MAFSVLGTRFGHTEGRVSLAYSLDGEKVVTLGHDGELRTWKGLDDDDCENFLVGDEGLSLAVSEKRMYVGASQSNLVAAYSWDGDSEGVTARFTADVTCMAAAGGLLAAGSADMTLKVVNTTDFTETVLEGHQGPILSVALSSQGDFVASAGCDGSVRLWEVKTKTVTRTIENVVTKTNDVTASLSMVGLQFSRCGRHLAVPTATGLTVLSRGPADGPAWAPPKAHSLTQLGKGELPTALAWGPEGDLLLLATNKGNLLLLSFPALAVVRSQESGRRAAICSVAWHPARQEAAFADLAGHWGLVEDIRGDATKVATAEDAEDMEALFNDDEEDEDEENSFSIGKAVAATGYVKDDDGNLTFGAAGEDGVRPESAASGAEGGAAVRVVRQLVREEVRLQPAFQPGASPPGLTNRFLVYNSVGIVRSHSSEEESSLDVEFHDVAVHHSLHLPNPESAVTMAALGAGLLALASPDKLTVNYFSSSDVSKEWSLPMEEDETVLGLAVGEGWVALATSRNFLRVVSAGGMQREVASLPGPLVSMAGHGNRLLLALHAGHPLPGQQALSAAVYTVTPSLGLRLGSCRPLPLSPGSELYWLGFTDLGAPASADTTGVLRVEDSAQAVWLPLLDSSAHARGRADCHYIVSVSQTEGEARCVLCRGARYPPTLPRPLPTSLPLAPPLAGAASERGELEGQAAMLGLQARLVGQARDRTEETEECLASVRNQEVACVMKLFALACRSDHESRAVEVARLLPDVDTMQLAIKYAAKQRRAGLADRLGKLAMELQEREEEQEVEAEREEEEEESQDMFAPTQENPFLANRDNATPKAILPSQTKLDARNPFAKRAAGPAAASPSAQGFVFDSVDGGSGSAEKRGFGEKRSVLPAASKAASGKPKPRVARQPLLPKPENTGVAAAGGELRGVALYIEESRERLEQEVGKEKAQEAGLSQWKSLSADVKEGYKVARVPGAEGGKRKRSEEVEDEAKQGKASTKQKLAGFAFAGN